MKSKILLPALMLILASCSSELGTSGPKYAAKQFTENLAKGNITEAKKYATESTGRLLGFANSLGILDIASFWGSLPGGFPMDPDFVFEAERDSIVGNRAWVFYRTPDGTQEVVELVKVDGKWLVLINVRKTISKYLE